MLSTQENELLTRVGPGTPMLICDHLAWMYGV